MKRNLMFPLAMIIISFGCVRAGQKTDNQATVTIHTESEAKPYDPMIFKKGMANLPPHSLTIVHLTL
jgi:hypothetical protein